MCDAALGAKLPHGREFILVSFQSPNPSIIIPIADYNIMLSVVPINNDASLQQ
jgi:hypothetical protein